jgi:serine/threonine protein kinase
MAHAQTPLVLISPTIGEPHIGQTLGGMYRVLGKLNEGGMGKVFLADNVSLPGQKTVVKVMQAQSENDKEMLRREAKQLVNIRHPTVVSVLAFGEERDFQYLAMEYLEGQTLEEIINKYKQLGVLESIRIGLRIADALHACHEQGLVHRDLKPANVMVKLAKDPAKFLDWLKLIDFGLTLQTGEKSEAAMGTPQYIAPEQALNEATGPATDLYALGVILFEMLTGQLPYTESDTVALLQAHITKRIPRVRELAPYIDEDVDELVFDLMQKEQNKRPETAALAAKRLARLERYYAEQATNLRRAAETDAGVAVAKPSETALPDSAGTVPKEHAPTVIVDSTLTLPPSSNSDVTVDTATLSADRSRRYVWALLIALICIGLGGFSYVWFSAKIPPEGIQPGTPKVELTDRQRPLPSVVAEANALVEARRLGLDVEAGKVVPLTDPVAPENPAAADTSVAAKKVENVAAKAPEFKAVKSVKAPGAATAEKKLAVVIKDSAPGGQVKVEQTECVVTDAWKRKLARSLEDLELLVSKRETASRYDEFVKEMNVASAMIEKADAAADCARAVESVEQMKAKYRR